MVRKRTYRWTLLTLLEDGAPGRPLRGAALIGAPGRSSVAVAVDEGALDDLISTIPKYPPIRTILVDTPWEIRTTVADVLGDSYIYRVSYRVERRATG